MCNKKVFGNVIDNVAAAEESVRVVEYAFELDPFEQNLVEMNRVSKVLNHALAVEEAFSK